MPRVNGKFLDETMLFRRFNEHPESTLGDLAADYDMTEAELIEWLVSHNSDSDEQKRVRQMIKQNDKRKRKQNPKRKQKVAKQLELNGSAETVESVESVESTEQEVQIMEKSIAVKKQELIARSEEAQQNLVELNQELSEAQQELQDLEILAKQARNNCKAHQAQFLELEASMNRVRQKIAEAEEGATAAEADVEKKNAQISALLQVIQDAQKHADSLDEEMAELNSKVVYLIVPGYAGVLPETAGRFVSTVAREGVEVVETDGSLVGALSFSEAIGIMQACGYEADELYAFYRDQKFAEMAVIEFGAGYETHVFPEDSKVIALIEAVKELF